MNSTASPPLNVTRGQNNVNVNASWFYIEEELQETSLGEILQTQVVAGVMTVLSSALILLTVLVCRFLIKKYFRRNRDLYNSGLHNSEPNKSSHFLLPDEMKTSESQFSVIPAEELEEVMTSYNAAPSNHTSKSTANGSIITLTMKNNHLIVETEERISGVIESPPEVIPQVFVVELQDNLPSALPGELDALVHQSEDDLSDEEYMEGANTGLSQSDLSASSEGSVNPSYRYGNQTEYIVEGHPHDLQKVPSRLPMCRIVQQSQDEDELYLEQQRQLGGVEELRTVPEIPECNQFVNPAYVPTPESQINPIT